MLKFKLIFLMLFFCLLLLFGQVEKENSSFNKVWFSYNLGLSGTNAEADNWNSGLYHSLGLNMSSPYNNVKIRFINNMPGGPFTEFPQRVYELGVLYGLKPNYEYGNVILSGGISLVSGYYYKSSFDDSIGYVYDKKTFKSVGFPLELQFNWNAFKKFGLGLSVFGNMNNERSFYGAGNYS